MHSQSCRAVVVSPSAAYPWPALTSTSLPSLVIRPHRTLSSLPNCPAPSWLACYKPRTPGPLPVHASRALRAAHSSFSRVAGELEFEEPRAAIVFESCRPTLPCSRRLRSRSASLGHSKQLLCSSACCADPRKSYSQIMDRALDTKRMHSERSAATLKSTPAIIPHVRPGARAREDDEGGELKRGPRTPARASNRPRLLDTHTSTSR